MDRSQERVPEAQQLSSRAVASPRTRQRAAHAPPLASDFGFAAAFAAQKQIAAAS
jgi:hypothetical protein